MKTLTLNKNSWHYSLVSRYGDWDMEYHQSTDLCSYIKALISIFMGMIVASIVVIFLSYPLIDLGMVVYINTAYHLWGGVLVTSTTAFFGLGELIGLIIIGIVCWMSDIKEKRRHYNYMNDIKKEPGFIKLAYNSIKDKTCFRIEFK